MREARSATRGRASRLGPAAMKANTEGSPITAPEALCRLRRIISRASSVMTPGSASTALKKSSRSSASTSESRRAATVAEWGEPAMSVPSRRPVRREADYAQELRLAESPPRGREGSETSGAQEVEVVGVLAGFIQRRAAGQREPNGATGRDFPREQAGKGGRRQRVGEGGHRRETNGEASI